jgi:hypothetical protein
MMDSKHPFVYNWQVKHRPTFRRNASVPAWANCSLDGNPGNGDLRQGMTFDTPINSWLTWDSETIVDETDRWEMTVMLDEASPLDECTVDLTPRNLQRFKAQPGRRFRWRCTFLPPTTESQEQNGASPANDLAARLAGGRRLGGGTVTADEWGLVTIPQMRMLKGAQRVVIQQQ